MLHPPLYQRPFSPRRRRGSIGGVYQSSKVETRKNVSLSEFLPTDRAQLCKHCISYPLQLRKAFALRPANTYLRTAPPKHRSVRTYIFSMECLCCIFQWRDPVEGYCIGRHEYKYITINIFKIKLIKEYKWKNSSMYNLQNNKHIKLQSNEYALSPSDDCHASTSTTQHDVPPDERQEDYLSS